MKCEHTRQTILSQTKSRKQLLDQASPSGAKRSHWQDTFKLSDKARFVAQTSVEQLRKWALRSVPSTSAGGENKSAEALESVLKPGDLILAYRTDRPNLGHLGYWTTGAHNTHVMLYKGEGKALHAPGGPVSQIRVSSLSKVPSKLTVVRPPYKSEQDIQKALSKAESMLGMPYDNLMDNGTDDKVYCSEFVRNALTSADPSLEAPEKTVLGRKVTSPDDFLKIPGTRVVHDGGSNYWSNQLHQWPTHLTSVAAGALGFCVGGVVGLGLGLAVGHEAGLKLQSLASKKTD